MADSRSNPYNVIDPNGYGWWAPTEETNHAELLIEFTRSYTINRIEIKWHVKVPKYEIQVVDKLQDKDFKTIIVEEPSDDVDLRFSPTEVTAIKVILLDLDKKTMDQNTIYGIKKIQVHRPG